MSEKGKKYKEYKFSSHAIQRMFERKIQKNEVITGICNGEIIKNYDDDKPYPSHLILAGVNNRALHILIAVNEEENLCYIITVYEPDKKIWENNLKSRRK